MESSRCDVPQYADDSESSSESDSSIESLKEATVNVGFEEYEDNDDDEKKSSFYAIEDRNCFLIDCEQDAVVVGLSEKQRMYISGVFKLQVVKGGIVYNNVHYNASRETFNVWHPLCNAIPAIQGSFYAGWDETVVIEDRYKDVVVNDLKEYSCVVRIQNGAVKGLMDVGELFPEVRYLWRTPDSRKFSFVSDNCTYSIMTEDIDQFNALHIPNEWSTTIEKLSVVHKSSLHDTRMMIIGGKNSGKSTLLRLLTENFLFGGDIQAVDNEVSYLDLDPGQPEYSDPDCISLTRIQRKTRVLGRHLGQPCFEIMRQHYIGSSSPQEMPSSYLDCVSDLISYLEELNQMGTSLVNLPGWIKGFGLNIIGHILSRYKPTHIVILESKGSRRHLKDLNLDLTFNSSSRSEYRPVITTIAGISINPDDFRFQPPQIRTLKTLLYFHMKERSNTSFSYDFAPLLLKPPVQISFGTTGIQGFSFPEEFAGLHEKDIRTALEGTIVGLYMCVSSFQDSLVIKGPFPILTRRPAKMQFISLALIHSVNTDEKFMNVFVPETKLSILRSNSQSSWLIFRAKSETPFCELYPRDNLFSDDRIPYISFDLRKKHEHVWKVRKNVMRRGHHLK
ncbi:hypothetical protein HG537_0A01610 [Torulaspora globosa]|uniref:Polynucleotide 5'-hydroxyl-kinase GRC3 n=1 Tax=Torulaspora globosa TaxID=48254 RepID=A0A7H9HJ14_9SACH|nr:hypothetical protein HG537_0A01610 [Torulaspora sp. CBS 2947]